MCAVVLVLRGVHVTVCRCVGVWCVVCVEKVWCVVWGSDG